MRYISSVIMSNPFEGLSEIGQYVSKNRSAIQMASKKTIQELFKPFNISGVYDVRNDTILMSKLLTFLKGDSPMTLEQFKAKIIEIDDGLAYNIGIHKEEQEKKYQKYLAEQETRFKATLEIDANKLFYTFGTQFRYIFTTFHAWLTFCYYYLDIDLSDPEVRKMLYLFDKNVREGNENEAPLRGKMWEIAVGDKTTRNILMDIFIWSRACEYYGIDNSIKILYSKAGLDHKYKEYTELEKKHGTMTWLRPKNTHQPELDDKIINIERFSDLGLDEEKPKFQNKKDIKFVLGSNGYKLQSLWTSFKDWSSFMIIGLEMPVETAQVILKEYRQGANFMQQNWNANGLHAFIDAVARWMLYMNKDGNYLLDKRLDVIQTVFGAMGCFHKFHHAINHLDKPNPEDSITKKLNATTVEDFASA